MQRATGRPHRALFLFFLIVLLWPPVNGTAGMVLRYSLTSQSHSSSIEETLYTIFLQGYSVRIEETSIPSTGSERRYILYDCRTGRLCRVVPKHKAFSCQKIGKMALQYTVALSKLVPTADTEFFSGYRARRYILKDRAATMELWLSRDLSTAIIKETSPTVLQKLSAIMQKTIDNKIRTVLGQVGDKGWTVALREGRPYDRKGKKQYAATITLISAEKRKLPPAMFNLPQGYRQAIIPGRQPINNLPRP